MTDPLTPEAIAQQLNEEADSPFTPSPRRKLLKDAKDISVPFPAPEPKRADRDE